MTEEEATRWLEGEKGLVLYPCKCDGICALDQEPKYTRSELEAAFKYEYPSCQRLKAHLAGQLLLVT